MNIDPEIDEMIIFFGTIYFRYEIQKKLIKEVGIHGVHICAQIQEKE